MYMYSEEGEMLIAASSKQWPGGLLGSSVDLTFTCNGQVGFMQSFKGMLQMKKE